MNIKQINKEIRGGKSLDENVPKLFNLLADHYNTVAGVKLAMHYFAFYEAYTDDEDTWSKDAFDIANKVNHMIRENILMNATGIDRETAIQEVDSLRNEIMKRMNALTNFTDMFQIYEYVLNRVEYRFYGEIPTFDDDELAREVLRFIFDTEDNMIINEKIKEVIGQLPIRLTKQKYFELLKGSIQAYLGADVSSLESYLYMLKTSAMLYKEDGMESIYPSLWEKKELLSKLEYKDITKETYDKALNTLHAATLFLEIETNVFYSLQEIINEVYAILLCGPYAGMGSADVNSANEAALLIINEINEYFIKKEKRDISEELLDKFNDIEGIQEELSFDITTLEDSLYDINSNHKAITESLMLSQLLNILLRTKDLLSNSLFIDLDLKMSDSKVVDEERVDKEVAALEEELKTLFTSHDRMIGRAVMANTINKMPVFFINHKEIMDYVRYSLDRCSDIYEKAACFEIINDIMAD